MRYRLFFAFLILATSLKALDSLRVEQQDGNYYILHQVDPGETVYSISKRYDVLPELLTSQNDIRGNALDVGELLRIPFEPSEAGETHEVQPGETLYSISRLYGIAVEEIREWNSLTSNELSVGQYLVLIPGGDPVDSMEIENATEALDSIEVRQSFTYFVQTGEDLGAIADKFGIEVDSIMKWNELASDRVSIGQALIFPFRIDTDSVRAVVTEVPDYRVTSYGSKKREYEEGGIRQVIEEGVARRIQSDIRTSKYLALHRRMRVGDVLEVKNLMNNTRVYVRVVGTLPDTGINKNVMIRLTESVFEALGIIDKKALVEITYFDN